MRAHTYTHTAQGIKRDLKASLSGRESGLCISSYWHHNVTCKSYRMYSCCIFFFLCCKVKKKRKLLTVHLLYIDVLTTPFSFYSCFFFQKYGYIECFIRFTKTISDDLLIIIRKTERLNHLISFSLSSSRSSADRYEWIHKAAIFSNRIS